MMNWLQSRTDRERILIYILIGLFLTICVWLVFLNPILSAKRAADNAYFSAKRDFDVVQMGLPKISQHQESDSKQSFDRSALYRTAQAHRLEPARIQPGSDGEFQIWFDDAVSQDIYAYLKALTRDYNVRISRAQISQRDGGFVSAQFTLTPP